MKSYHVSFGQNHIHKLNGAIFDKDSLCQIDAETYEKAREIAFEAFGSKWSMIYTRMPDPGFFPRGIIKLSK